MKPFPLYCDLIGMNAEYQLRDALMQLSESEKVDMIIHLMKQVEEMTSQIAILTGRVSELEARLNMNSSNSSKPPSSDGYAKPAPKSLRRKSGRKPGGQPGHPGTTLTRAAEPDEIRECTPTHCACGRNVENDLVHHVECRQVFDLPEKLFFVTEYRLVAKRCAGCGQVVCADAPPEAPAPVQYGPRFRAVMVYLRNYQLLPYQRLSQLFRDIFGAPVSKRTIESAQQQAYEALAPFEQEVRRQLERASVLHADETGMRVDGKRQWFHTLSTLLLTLYQAHAKRGGEAIEDSGVIPAFKGVLVHDCWGPYFHYGDQHALCGAHLLRELIGISENDGYRWAHELAVLLEMMADITKALEGRPLSEPLKRWFEQTYDDILYRGQHDLPPPQKTPGKRGRVKKSKAANLHERLVTHRESVLRFLNSPLVPFTNNLAERDIRMVKLREKTSGCSRTFSGAATFARIRGYISTSAKQGKNLLQNIQDALSQNPWIPQSETSNS